MDTVPTRSWRRRAGVATVCVALGVAFPAGAGEKLTAPSKGQLVVPVPKPLPRLDIKTMKPIDLESLVKTPAPPTVDDGKVKATEPGKVPATYPPPDGNGPTTAGDFQSTPLPDDEPDPPETVDPAPSDRAPSAGQGPRPSTQPTSPPSESIGTGAPSVRRVPTSTGTLLGTALPTLDASPADGMRNDDPPAADYEPGQVVFLTADGESARQVAAGVLAQGIRVRSRTTLAGLGWVMSVASLPPGIDVVAAAEVLAARFPDAVFDANHRYALQGGGRTYAAEMIGWEAAAPCLASAPIGMIDTPVNTSDPALAGARVDALDVLPSGLARPNARHGTAVATILAGNRQGSFAGLHASADIVAVNVFRRVGDEGVDSTAAWIVQGLDVLSTRGVAVINISLGGAANRVLDLAVRTLAARGIPVVAAAGNGGRDAPPVYPAAYPDVIAVTAVDADGRVYRRANRGDFVDFAAPGVDVFVPSGEGGYLSGTSYAAPFVTAAVAAVRARRADLEPAAVADYLASLSRDLGESGRDAVFGFGLPDLSGHCAAIARLD